MSGPNDVSDAPTGIEFDIISRSGLMAVAFSAVVLIVGIRSRNLWLLQVLHVGGGATWMVLDVFLGFVLGPILNTQTFTARISIASKLLPKMLLLMPTAVTMTLAAGWVLGSLLGNTQPGSPAYRYIVASYFLAAILEVTALGFLQPANVAVMFEIKQPHPNPEVVGSLMKRFVFAARVLGIAQIGILLLMTRIASLT